MPAPHIHIPYPLISEHLKFLKDLRPHLEIYFGAASLDSVSREEVIQLREMLEYGPDLSIHGPFMDLCPGAVDAQVRKVTMSRFFHTLDIAEILRPKTVVFHSGYEKWKYGLSIDLWLEKSLQTWRPIQKRASEIGVRIAVENIFEDASANLKALMDEMHSEDFGICFDTGHFNLFSKTPLEEWMSDLNPYILELHLHDNDGTADQHLPPGEGTFDFPKFFALLANRNCVHTIEAHSPGHVLRALESLRRFTGI